MLPLKITNRLSIGRDLAAVVESRRPGYKAWVYVWPVVALPDDWQRSADPGSEPRLNGADQDKISGYGVRFLEINEKHHNAFADADYVADDPTTIDEVCFVKGLDALEEAIGRYTQEFDQLRPPPSVLYPELPLRI